MQIEINSEFDKLRYQLDQVWSAKHFDQVQSDNIIRVMSQLLASSFCVSSRAEDEKAYKDD